MLIAQGTDCHIGSEGGAGALEVRVESLPMAAAPGTAFGFTATLGAEPIARVDEPLAYMLHHHWDGLGIASSSVAA